MPLRRKKSKLFLFRFYCVAWHERQETIIRRDILWNKTKKNESRKEMNVVGCTRDRGRIPTKESFNLRNRRRRRKNHFFSGTIFDNDKLMTLCTEGMAPEQTKTRNKKIEEDTPPVRHSVESAEWDFFFCFSFRQNTKANESLGHDRRVCKAIF